VVVAAVRAGQAALKRPGTATGRPTVPGLGPPPESGNAGGGRPEGGSDASRYRRYITTTARPGTGPPLANPGPGYRPLPDTPGIMRSPGAGRCGTTRGTRRASSSETARDRWPASRGPGPRPPRLREGARQTGVPRRVKAMHAAAALHHDRGPARGTPLQCRPRAGPSRVTRYARDYSTSTSDRHTATDLLFQELARVIAEARRKVVDLAAGFPHRANGSATPCCTPHCVKSPLNRRPFGLQVILDGF